MTSAEFENPIAFVVTTHSRTEKYTPLVRDLLDTFWREHPPLVFLTDGASQQAADVISFPNTTWLDLFMAGLARVRRHHPLTTHVFHMLEDHCPLRDCDGKRLDRIFAIARRRDLHAVSFPTYPWPWSVTEATVYPDGLVRTWRRIDTVEFDGELFARVPPDFFRYFQVQPTLWRLDYLESLCAHAKAQGITDAWGFEAIRWPDARQHYISGYNWRSVHHGFLAQGRLNPEAIVYLDRGRAKTAHRALIRDAIGIGSPLLFDSIQTIVRTKRLIRRGLSGAKKRVLAKTR